MYEDMALEQLSSDKSFDSTFTAVKSSTSGIVSYYMDGYEGFDVNNLSADDFDKTKYSKELLKKAILLNPENLYIRLLMMRTGRLLSCLQKKNTAK